MSHIATPETFMHGAPEIESTCIVCGEISTQRTGWLDTYCSSCNRYIPHEGLNIIVRYRREELGLDRESMARITGLAKSTIAQYERFWPSKKYWELTKKLIEKS